MHAKKVTLSIPTHDLEKAYRFYLDGLNLTLAVEMPDGSRPEPVVFQLTPTTELMLVPTGGFDFITPGNQVAQAGVSECVLTVSLESQDAVRAFIAKAKQAGATIPQEPSMMPWGYVGYFKDLDGHLWMATCEA